MINFEKLCFTHFFLNFSFLVESVAGILCTYTITSSQHYSQQIQFMVIIMYLCKYFVKWFQDELYKASMRSA